MFGRLLDRIIRFCDSGSGEYHIISTGFQHHGALKMCGLPSRPRCIAPTRAAVYVRVILGICRISSARLILPIRDFWRR